jgi:nucleolar protein 14
MPPSQLKLLKSSLHSSGILGPQKSKKQRKSTGKDASTRAKRNAALTEIRDRFNPFEVKAPSRPSKYDFVNGKPTKSTPVGRPGITRGLGEERRRDTLLKEIQSRNRVGGVVDRRFGEDDPNMTPEMKAAERFARQNERKLRKGGVFNLEDDGDMNGMGEMMLTHGGRSLEFGDEVMDDFDEEDVGGSEDVEDERPRKRLRLDDDEGTLDEDGDAEEMPLRKKTKNEVMKEVIAKSKMYKAERQAAKADDDDLRAELDKGMSDIYASMREHKPPPKQQPPPSSTAEPQMDPTRAAMLAGKSRQDAEKEYEANLRQMKMEARSKPTVRTKTEEEKAAEEAARLEELERKRVRRMKGEADSSDEEDEEVEAEPGPDEDVEIDDAEAFGLSLPETEPQQRPELDVEDEDEFVIDDDLIASDSDADMASESEEESASENEESEDDGEDDFINGLVLPKEATSTTKAAAPLPTSANLAYTFPCPQTHDELLAITKDVPATDLPTIVQRIRALYHKGLAEGNQTKLDVFAGILTKHISYLTDRNPDIPFSVLESLIRHLHSMAKSSPESVSAPFRSQLEEIATARPLQLGAGDLVILTAVSTIFPTSDHFHSVVTPAMLTIARYLGQSNVQSLHDLGIGAYCCSLALRYQRLAGRYVPEVINYITNGIAILSPTPVPEHDKGGSPLNVPIRLPTTSLRLKTTSSERLPEKVSFKALVMTNPNNTDASHITALLSTFIRLTLPSATLWCSKSALPEIIHPLITILTHLSTQLALPSALRKLTKQTLTTLLDLSSTSTSQRKPLLLHNHRPLPIKASYPSFIDNYNPARHYDPDAQRSSLNKLKSEHRKEKKGAMRELRKDANFMAREQLREKKSRDEAYERKYRRIVSEIQGEEGRESKNYDRVKERRKASRRK